MTAERTAQDEDWLYLLYPLVYHRIGHGWMKDNLRDDPRFKILSIHINGIRKIRIRLARIEDIRISCRRLRTSELHSKGSSSLVAQFLCLRIKQDSPVVRVIGHRLRTLVVCLSTIDSPVDVVECLGFVVTAYFVRHTLGELIDEIVGAPVETVFFCEEGVCGRLSVAVAVFTRGFVRNTDAEEFFASRLGGPCRCYGRFFSGGDRHVVLVVVAKDTIGVDCETVVSCLYTGNGDFAFWGNVLPVLVRFGVEYVVLEVVAAFCEDSDGVLGSGRQVDLCIKSTTTRCWDEVRYVFCYGIVELGVPLWTEAVLLCVLSEFFERTARVEVEVLGSKGTIEAIGNVGCLNAVVIGDHVVVHDAVDNEIRMNRTVEVGLNCVMYEPCAVSRAIDTTGTVGVHAVGFVIAPCILESVLGEVVSYSLDIRTFFVGQIPCSVLDSNLTLGIWARCSKLLVGNEVCEECGFMVGPEHRTELL